MRSMPCNSRRKETSLFSFSNCRLKLGSFERVKRQKGHLQNVLLRLRDYKKGDGHDFLPKKNNLQLKVKGLTEYSVEIYVLRKNYLQEVYAPQIIERKEARAA